MSAEPASSTCRQLVYYTLWPWLLLLIWFLSEWRCWWSPPLFCFSNSRCSLIESKICAWSEFRIAQLPVWLLQAAEPCETWKSYLLPTYQIREDEGSLSVQTLVIEFLQLHPSNLKIYTNKNDKSFGFECLLFDFMNYSTAFKKWFSYLALSLRKP